MPDIKFRLKKRPMSYSAMAEWYSTLCRFMGHFDSATQFFAAMRRFINWRRWWLQQLHKAGCARLRCEKYTWIRNCRPCSVQVLPAGIQSCEIPFCPFCHAREVADRADRAHWLCKTLTAKGEDIKLVRYRRFTDDGDSTKIDQLMLDIDGDIDATCFNEVLVRHRRIQADIRKRFFGDALAAWSWTAFIPWAYDEPNEFGSGGRWIVTHAVVAIVPKAWKFDDPEVLESDGISGRSVARLVETTFRYPIAWFKAEPKLVAQLFNLTFRKRMFSTFGPYREDYVKPNLRVQNDSGCDDVVD